MSLHHKVSIIECDEAQHFHYILKDVERHQYTQHCISDKLQQHLPQVLTT